MLLRRRKHGMQPRRREAEREGAHCRKTLILRTPCKLCCKVKAPQQRCTPKEKRRTYSAAALTLSNPARAGILRGFVFNRTPVRLRLRRSDGLARQRLIQCRLDVIRRIRDV